MLPIRKNRTIFIAGVRFGVDAQRECHLQPQHSRLGLFNGVNGAEPGSVDKLAVGSYCSR